MIRHRNLTLLAVPLLLSPAAALASPAAAAPLPAASCELVATGEGGSGPYTLVLEGFEPNQSVTIKGPQGSQRTRVGAEGTLDRQGARYGQYTVTAKGKRTGCLTPPRQQPDGGKQGKVQVTKVEVFTLTKPGTVVDCTKPSRAEFDGKITGSGNGKVPYYWTYASSSEPYASGTATFGPGVESVSLLKVVPLSPTVNGVSPSVFVTLHVGNMSARSDQVTLTCAKP
ncbi:MULTISPECIES: hypothetical protein [Streptomyces]|uniref:hypothetical protein n=1 Tax=Streptomyces TaxID=1883 RepID=UPI000F6FAB62|nr:hypothetical protein [Streptomyces sp. W1SF4]AZM88922.1 hypothetical protein D1J60_10845 [Streptomyces sp. W1SF4]